MIKIGPMEYLALGREFLLAILNRPDVDVTQHQINVQNAKQHLEEFLKRSDAEVNYSSSRKFSSRKSV